MKRTRLLLSVLVLVCLTIAFFRYRWHRLDYYEPGDSITFAAPFRTMAEHNEFMRDKEWPYVLRIDGDKSALLYYGSWHTTDPGDPQIAEIQEFWREFRPTVAVTENRLGLFVGSLSMGIKVFSEFATVFYLARDAGVPVYTLEPSWDAEVAEMKSSFPTEEVTLFYTLRVFLSERKDVSRDEIDDLASHLLGKRGNRPGLKGSLPDLAALDKLWDKCFSQLGPWRELAPEAIHPSAEPSRLQELANLANEIRDRHAARVIIDLLAKGERVFALAGGSHVVKQEPVLIAWADQ